VSPDTPPPFDVVEITTDGACGRVRSEWARCACAGHFPGDPLLPGSALLAVMVDVAARLMGTVDLPPARVRRCTFRRTVRPNEEIIVRGHTVGTGRAMVAVEASGRRVAEAAVEFGHVR